MPCTVGRTCFEGLSPWMNLKLIKLAFKTVLSKTFSKTEWRMELVESLAVLSSFTHSTGVLDLYSDGQLSLLADCWHKCNCTRCSFHFHSTLWERRCLYLFLLLWSQCPDQSRCKSSLHCMGLNYFRMTIKVYWAVSILSLWMQGWRWNLFIPGEE